jgi:thiamine biosynthesis lipoprotein
MKPVVFRHEAMATHFEIAVAGGGDSYARQAAAAAFRELDRLEGELSRFIESSDIGRANRVPEAGSLAIGDDAMECLLLAAAVAEATRGAFDPAFRSGGRREPAAGTPAFTIDPASHSLTSHVPRLELDLGAVGKGYALDRMAGVLAEWEVDSACLNSGGSTVLCLAPPHSAAGWVVGIGDGDARRELTLARSALSGSGLAVKGHHLVDPRTGGRAARTLRAWASAPQAALADALSTAFFVMEDAEVAAFCADHAGIGAALSAPGGRLLCHGTLDPSVLSDKFVT